VAPAKEPAPLSEVALDQFSEIMKRVQAEESEESSWARVWSGSRQFYFLVCRSKTEDNSVLTIQVRFLRRKTIPMTMKVRPTLLSNQNFLGINTSTSNYADYGQMQVVMAKENSPFLVTETEGTGVFAKHDITQFEDSYFIVKTWENLWKADRATLKIENSSKLMQLNVTSSDSKGNLKGKGRFTIFADRSATQAEHIFDADCSQTLGATIAKESLNEVWF